MKRQEQIQKKTQNVVVKTPKLPYSATRCSFSLAVNSRKKGAKPQKFLKNPALSQKKSVTTAVRHSLFRLSAMHVRPQDIVV
ncbi:MAG: hypothetical protein IJ049_04070 [Oscillospiraceae bacterium]|nr:hypothetical protein [Oscillospiraceae bacterium]